MFEGPTYEAYDALVNPPTASNSSPSGAPSMSGNTSLDSGLAGSGMSAGYTTMDASELLNPGGIGGAEDILALLTNQNMESSWDFGMLLNETGTPLPGNATGSDMGGVYASPSAVFGSGMGYEAKDGFATGTA